MRAGLRYLSREAESAMLFCVVALNSRCRILVAVSEFDRKRMKTFFGKEDDRDTGNNAQPFDGSYSHCAHCLKAHATL